MKLDPTVMRTMNGHDFDVLEAVERGMKNHSLVPLKLVCGIANLRHSGGTQKILSTLIRDKLLAHEHSSSGGGGYDGYRLTNSGHDVLALHALKRQRHLAALGDKIGTGKESDVYLAATPTGRQVVVKFHRLGRTSFRNVKKKRDYVLGGSSNPRFSSNSNSNSSMPNSWLTWSSMSARKEYAFMKALHQENYPTPEPLGYNRHVVVMSVVRGMPLYQLPTSRLSDEQAWSILQQSTTIAIRLAQVHGLVHCDLNEFNLLVNLRGGGSGSTNSSGSTTAAAPTDDDHDYDDNDDHYVRHSGLPSLHAGALSAPMSAVSLQHDNDDGMSQQHDGNTTAAGNVLVNAHDDQAPSATATADVERLDNGQPKPIVTLIDFPQMVSTEHVNAQELFERDMNCLKRFFVNKVKCITSTEWDEEELIPSWTEIKMDCRRVIQNDESMPSTTTTPTANNSQAGVRRLDQQLKASGYLPQDSSRDMELFYFEHPSSHSQELARSQVEDGIDNSEAKEGDSTYGEKGSEGHDNERPMQDTGDTVESEIDGNEQEQSIHQIDTSMLATQSRAVVEEKTRLRVRRQLEDQKRRNGKKGAFRSRNSNKTYVKGKRVMTDVGY